MNLLRYDDIQAIGTDLDPIEDILNFISMLKSKGFTSNILRKVHNFTDDVEIECTAKLISLHVNNAIGLAQQAFYGPPEVSFLPLYYSTLNLSKVHLLLLGKRTELEKNRFHGAKYTENEMEKDFLDEEIHIQNTGTIPLMYKTITDGTIERGGFKIRLREFYSAISSIGAEYSMITGKEMDLMCHAAEIVEDDENGHYIRIDIADPYYHSNPPRPEMLKAYSELNMIHDSSIARYETTRIKEDFEHAKQRLVGSVKRYLNSDCLERLNNGTIRWLSYTPISDSHHIFSEEMCIMLAYFHLSNVVRYNPEHLYKLMDSKYWSVMLGLRKHGYLTFLKLMWGNYNKKSFDIR